MLNTSTILDDAITEHLAATPSLSAHNPTLERIATEIPRTLLAGNKASWCGNGGEAHIFCGQILYDWTEACFLKEHAAARESQNA